jgi:pimeloyl-ACP methyl ester carboxylesterase
VPTLVVHGNADRILPIDATARRLPELIADCILIEIDDGPHMHGDAGGAADDLCDVVLVHLEGPDQSGRMR